MSTWKERKRKGQPRDFGKAAAKDAGPTTWETIKAGFSILRFFAWLKKWLQRILKGVNR